MATTAIRANERSLPFRVSTRLRLIGAGIALLALTVLALVVANNSYTTTLELFRGLVEVNAAKVNASEAALAAIARVDSQAANFIATAPDDAKHWDSLDGIHRSFQEFRAQMGTVRANLASESETTTYNQAERYAFDDFWQHIGNLLSAQIVGDRAAAIRSYVTADNYLQNQVVVYLLKLETLNYSAMEATKKSAAGIIAVRTFMMAVIAFGLAILLTVASFWLRGKVKRYLTPGLDLAMVVAWIIALVLFFDLARTPGQLDRMVDDAYKSVTGSARVLVIGNQADINQSGAVIDSAGIDDWNKKFDKNIADVERRICGTTGCLQSSFTTTNSSDDVRGAVASAAKAAPVDNLIPLVGNVTFEGEAAALERARVALVKYLALNKNVRDLLAKNQVDDASLLATGDSAKAFETFSNEIANVQNINKGIFEETWQTVQGTLTRDLVLLIFGGYLVVFIGIIAGVIHRERELR
jgi:hypothetical protein